ncbi:MAG TPA: AraC family transcriptional regulator [Clostridiales bacterium]|nr:AraC family transcriptional regulator [Clostridiales bacterium]
MDAYFEKYRELENSLACFESWQNACMPHFHSNIEVVYVLDGEIEITINGTSRLLSKGCVSVANSYDIHSYHTPKESHTLILIVPIDTVHSYNTKIRGKTFASPFLNPGESSDEIYYALQQILKYKKSDWLETKGYLYVILGTLIRELGLKSSPKTSNSTLAREILIYLEQNYTNKITITSLAKRFGYNKDYLSRFFNSYFGYGFNKYLNILRSRHAVQLIKQTNDNLTQIAFQSGFDNYRTFNRAFTSVYNMTPSQFRVAYREQYKQSDNSGHDA